MAPVCNPEIDKLRAGESSPSQEFMGKHAEQMVEEWERKGATDERVSVETASDGRRRKIMLI